MFVERRLNQIFGESPARIEEQKQFQADLLSIVGLLESYLEY